MMPPDGFSFEDALKPAAEPKGFSFEDALKSAPEKDTYAGTGAEGMAETPPPTDTAGGRIGKAAEDAYRATPSFFTPKAQEAIDTYGGPIGQQIVNPAGKIVGGAIGAANAGMAGLSQAAMEALGEKGGRDALALLSSVPMAQGERMSPNPPEGPFAAGKPASPYPAADVPVGASPRLQIGSERITPGQYVDRVTQDQASIADIGKAPNIDGAIAAAGEAAQAPVSRPVAEWMQPVSREPAALEAPRTEPVLTGEVLPPEPASSGAPQSMADYLKANAVEPSMPTPQAITASIDAGDIVNTSKAAKQVASAYYKIADEAGDHLPPEITSKTLDYAKGLADEDPFVTAARGNPHPIADMVNRLEDFRDEPLSLRAQQGFDKLLGDKIDAQYQNGRLSSEGAELLDLQTYLRNLIQDEIDNPSGAGLPGFEAKIAANKAWQAAMQLDDLERIQERANRTENPATSIKTQINALLSNRSRSRGYTEAERAALEKAASRGVLAGALNIVGSRLVPIALGTHGALTLNPATLAASGVGMAASAAARRGVVAIQNNRLNNARNVIGSKVPPAPPAP